MKRFSTLLAAASLVFSFNLYAQKQAAVKQTNEPYKVLYKNLALGNSAFSQKVLQAWKDYDNNMLDNSVAIFDDNVEATLPDGSTIKGKENFIKAMKDYRNIFSAVNSEVHAVTTLKTPDDPEHDIALIWGVETDTKKDGTIQKTAYHEVWFFNRAGKVSGFHQFAAAIPPDNK
jgi:hypothetical protein